MNASIDSQASSRAIDPRPARTRIMILDAIERLGSQNLAITVASVVNEAQLSRSSFYSQFRDLGDVAVQLIRETQTRDAQSLQHTSSSSVPQTAVRALVNEFEHRRSLYAAVFGTNCTMHTLGEIYDILTRWIQLDISRTSPCGINARYASTYIASGIFGILIDWAVKDNPCPSAYIEAEILELLPVWLVSEMVTDPSESSLFASTVE